MAPIAKAVSILTLINYRCDHNKLSFFFEQLSTGTIREFAIEFMYCESSHLAEWPRVAEGPRVALHTPLLLPRVAEGPRVALS